MNQDIIRDENLFKLNLSVLRFSNLDVLKSIDEVVSAIFNDISFYINPP